MDDPATGRIESLRRKIQDDPGSKLFLQLAEAFRSNGELEEALETCRKGLEKHPCYHSARVSLGRLYLELGRPEDAEKELQSVLREVPDNLLASRLLEEIKTGTVRAAAAPKSPPAPDAAPKPPPAAAGTRPPVPQAVTPGTQPAKPQAVTPGIQPAKPQAITPGTQPAGKIGDSPNRESMSNTEQEPFETETLAEIYLEQGHRDKAVRIFERILKSEPENTRIRDRLETLRGKTPDVPPAANGDGEAETVQRKIAVLRGWLDRIHKG
jgi:tetratricopeptide (TPR) repeat protein